MTRRQQRPGLSLVEVLIVVAMVGVLAGMLVPALLKVRAAAARARTSQHLGQLGLATHNFAGNNHNKLPVNCLSLNGKNGSVFYHLLPYVGHPHTYHACATEAVVEAYLSPQDFTQTGGRVDGFGATNYAGNALIFNAGKQPCLPTAFNPAGASNVVMYSTRYAHCGPARCAWSHMGPDTLFGATGPPQFGVSQADCRVAYANAFTRTGLLVCLGDGGVRTVNPGISAAA